MSTLITLATCSLNQWALDWEGNRDRIVESIIKAKAAGALLRVGPELEITGYDCLDHFLESDVYLHSWDMLRSILENKDCYGIYLDIGMPVEHKNCRYNCRILALDGKILLIRPKLFLANDGNYREMRFFTPWPQRYVDEDGYKLPLPVSKLQGQSTVPIGDAVISTPDTAFAAETCEELFTPDGPHGPLGLNGVEILTNSSGSHHSLRKLDLRMALIIEATRKSGGIYLYANQKGTVLHQLANQIHKLTSEGGGGERLYYDGSSMIVVNGRVVAQGAQFSLDDVEVVTATCDLEEVRSFRFAPSRGQQVNNCPKYKHINTTLRLASDNDDIDLDRAPSPPREIRYHSPWEEIARGPGCYLWDYLRRSRQAGYLVPLSGGVDSCATAVIVFSMCRIVMEAIEKKNSQVIADVRRIAGAYGQPDEWLPKSPEELCHYLFHTVYMGMKTQSSNETRSRAKQLAADIGAYHTDTNIDEVFQAQKAILRDATNFEPKFRVHGGTLAENLALQNIQARSRMVTAYNFAQLLPTIRERKGAGGLLVLGSANVDECLRGYLTKYDCSSADINPIGSISKTDLQSFIGWAEKEFALPILADFLTAVPTAELEPITDDYVQADEVDMGMTYNDLSRFGILRKVNKLGPYGMFVHLLHEWKEHLSPAEVAKKVKDFHHYYSINRHKMTTMTPAYHAETYSPDDNRHDLRPFLYPPLWSGWAFKRIDAAVERLKQKKK